MRKQLCERDVCFASLCKLGPELCSPSVELILVLLQHVQDTCATDSFRRRPYQNKRVVRPRMFAARIAKSAVKINDLLPVLPNRNRSSELPKLFEVFLEQRFQSREKFFGIEVHDRKAKTRSG